MLTLKSSKDKKSASTKVSAYTHVVVYRAPRAMGFAEPATLEQAMQAFNACLAQGHIDPHNGRSLAVMTVASFEQLRHDKPELVARLEANAINAADRLAAVGSES